MSHGPVLTSRALRALPIGIAMAALASSALASPTPIALDPGFGSGGVVLGAKSIPSFQDATALGIAPGDDIVVAGKSSFGRGVTVVRYRPNGSLDPGFGAGAGYLQLPDPNRANALAIDSAGRTVVLTNRSTITRVSSAGELDPSFGDQGSVQPSGLNPGRESVRFTSLAVLSDDRIVAAGIRNGSPRMVAVRLRVDGSLDPSFGRHGFETLTIHGRSRFSGAFQVAAQPNNRILLAGYAHGSPALVRLRPNGAPDPGFGHRGVARSQPGLYGQATEIALQRDGKILLAGRGSRRGRAGTLLMRVRRDGELDRGFGAAGVAIDRRGSGNVFPAAVLPTARRIFLVTSGSGPGVRAYRLDGRPTGSLARVAGVPRNRFTTATAALQGGKLVLTWNSAPRYGYGVIHLERFVVR